jgi:hypothetical protein
VLAAPWVPGRGFVGIVAICIGAHRSPSSQRTFNRKEASPREGAQHHFHRPKESVSTHEPSARHRQPSHASRSARTFIGARSSRSCITWVRKWSLSRAHAYACDCTGLRASCIARITATYSIARACGSYAPISLVAGSLPRSMSKRRGRNLGPDVKVGHPALLDLLPRSDGLRVRGVLVHGQIAVAVSVQRREVSG